VPLTAARLGRADEIAAVEPDDRMRSVLTREVPEVRAMTGRGESMPLPDGCAGAVPASSSWHWMDPVRSLLEVVASSGRKRFPEPCGPVPIRMVLGW